MHVLVEGVQEISTMFQVMEHGKVKTISCRDLSFQIFMLSKIILDENMKRLSILIEWVPGWKAVPSPKGKNYFLWIIQS
jgi:hypothetical protein